MRAVLLPLLFAAACSSLHAEPLRKRLDAASGAGTPPVRIAGSVPRALDPSGSLPGTVDVHYEFYPQRDPSRPNAGTIVAAEGGPGYPSTASRAAYLALFEPLLGDRHLLLVDQRGTGRSAAVRCAALQADAFYTPPSVAACGAQLGATAALFGTALAADDLAAVLDTLQIGRVDLYGDSYGTFFAQAFAGRHPSRLRSVVLDAAYPVTGGDPWYPEAAVQARRAFESACAQSPACAAQPGASTARIALLLDDLRARPVSGSAPDGDGTLQPVTADARGLAYVMFSNASGPVVYRELDAAARAWAQGDSAPLLRLVAENQTQAAGAGAAAAFSAGLFAAVSCADYPQIYRMADAPAARHLQAAAAIAAKRATEPDVYAPFTIDEFLAMPQDYSVLNLCLPWPVPAAAFPPGQPVPPGAAFADVPVLVLSGEMDSLTPPAQGAQAAALFGRAQQVLLKNSFHVGALGDLDGCASTLVRRFVQTLSPGDTGCAAAIPAYPVVPAFARRAAELPPAVPDAGHAGTAADLRVVTAAVAAAGDVLARWWVNGDGTGVGLRGGRFRYGAAGGGVTRFDLDALRFTEDLPVGGSVWWDIAGREVRASLVVPGGALEARWPTRGSGARATVRGRLDGRRIAATLPAP